MARLIGKHYGRYADELVLCGESEEDLRSPKVARFVKIYRRRGQGVNADKSKVMEFNGKEGLEYEVKGDGMRLEHVKYLGFIFDES